MAEFSISKAAQAITGQGTSAFSLPVRKPKKPEVDEDWEKAKKVLNYMAENEARQGGAAPAQATFKKPRPSGLSAALSTAAYAAQANAGTPVPGQEWTQGIIKGLSGIGVSAAAAARMNAESEGKKATFANQMALLEQKKKNRMTADEEGEKARKIAEGRLPSELRKIQVSADEKERLITSKAGPASGNFSDEQQFQIKKQAWAYTLKEYEYKPYASDDEMSASYIVHRDRLAAQVPNLKVAPRTPGKKIVLKEPKMPE